MVIKLSSRHDRLKKQFVEILLTILTEFMRMKEI